MSDFATALLLMLQTDRKFFAKLTQNPPMFVMVGDDDCILYKKLGTFGKIWATLRKFEVFLPKSADNCYQKAILGVKLGQMLLWLGVEIHAKIVDYF